MNTFIHKPIQKQEITLEDERRKVRRGLDPEKFGIWEGCKGEYFFAGTNCRYCGKPRADHISAGVQKPQPQRTHQAALDKTPRLENPIIRLDAPCRIVITRGYGSAGPLDYDNFVGGLKILRDEITDKVLCRKSDAEKDGIIWEYKQVPGKGVKVEFFQEEEKEEIE